MDAFFTSSALVAPITLTFLEIVLGVDNVIFISILSSKLPGSQQGPARRIGFRIIRLTTPLFYILGRPISGRDLILIGAGLFLLAKSHDRDSRAFGRRRSACVSNMGVFDKRRAGRDAGSRQRLRAGYVVLEEQARAPFLGETRHKMGRSPNQWESKKCLTHCK